MEPIQKDEKPYYNSACLNTDTCRNAPALARRLSTGFSAGQLLQIAIFNIGSHYNQHCLSGLSPQIMSLFDTNRLAYGALYSSEELASIVLCVTSGIVLAYVPLAPMAFLFTGTVTLSAVLCAIAVTRISYPMLVAGRFLFGLTQGMLTTVQGAIIANRFSTHVGTAFGVMLLTSRLSSFAGLTMPAFFAERFGLGASMWIAAVTAIPPFISAAAFAMKRPPATGREENLTATNLTATAHPLDLLRTLSPPFWLTCYIWVVLSGVVYTTLHYSVDALLTRFSMTPAVASVISSSLMVVAGIASPCLGALQDRMHNQAAILKTCCACHLVGMGCLIAGLTIPPWSLVTKAAVTLAFIFLGLGFTAGPVTLMACVALVVPDASMPAALAIYKAAEGAGLAFLHVTFGILRDWTGVYVWSLAMLGLLAASGIIASEKLQALTEKDMKKSSTEEVL